MYQSKMIEKIHIWGVSYQIVQISWGVVDVDDFQLFAVHSIERRLLANIIPFIDSQPREETTNKNIASTEKWIYGML